MVTARDPALRALRRASSANTTAPPRAARLNAQSGARPSTTRAKNPASTDSATSADTCCGSAV